MSFFYPKGFSGRQNFVLHQNSRTNEKDYCISLNISEFPNIVIYEDTLHSIYEEASNCPDNEAPRFNQMIGNIMKRDSVNELPVISANIQTSIVKIYLFRKDTLYKK